MVVNDEIFAWVHAASLKSKDKLLGEAVHSVWRILEKERDFWFRLWSP